MHTHNNFNWLFYKNVYTVPLKFYINDYKNWTLDTNSLFQIIISSQSDVVDFQNFKLNIAG